MISFKKIKSGEMIYGRTKYDHDSGTMSFIKPRQVIAFNNIELEEDGFMIYIHEDYLNGHPLHAEIKNTDILNTSQTRRCIFRLKKNRWFGISMTRLKPNTTPIQIFTARILFLRTLILF